MKQKDLDRNRKKQTLIVGLRDPKVRLEAVTAIRAMGSSAEEFLGPLIKALEDSTARGRALLVHSTADAGLNQPDALPSATEPFDLVEADFRRCVIIAVGEIGSGTQKALRVLTTALEDSDAMVRTAAAGALGRMGLAATVSIPALIQLMGDSRQFVREIAARALGRIDPNDLRIIQPLTDALKDSSPGVRSSAAEALGNARPTEATATLLAGVLPDVSPAVKIAAAKSLAKFGTAARVAIPALTKALDTRFDSVRKAVSSALDRIGA